MHPLASPDSAALRAAVGAFGTGMANLKRAFCVPALGVVLPNSALRAAYERLEAELGQTLSHLA